MAELNCCWVAAVLAADTELDVRTCSSTELSCHLNKLAYANLVESCEWIVLINLVLIVSIEELTSVITAEAECHLGHRHDLTRAHKLPCETIHLVIVILAAHRNKIFPRHGAASHHIHNAEGHAYGQTFPVADQMTR